MAAFDELFVSQKTNWCASYYSNFLQLPTCFSIKISNPVYMMIHALSCTSQRTKSRCYQNAHYNDDCDSNCHVNHSASVSRLCAGSGSVGKPLCCACLSLGETPHLCMANIQKLLVGVDLHQDTAYDPAAHRNGRKCWLFYGPKLA